MKAKEEYWECFPCIPGSHDRVLDSILWV